MSESKSMPPIPEGIFTEEQLQKIGGGDCSATDWLDALSRLRDSYDQIVDFTSYVFERVIGQ